MIRRPNDVLLILKTNWPVWRAAGLNFYYRRRRLVIALGLALLIIVLWILPPAAYPLGRIIRIENGLSVSAAANYLNDKKVIQSPFLFKILIKILPGQPKIIAGDYMLNRRATVFGIIYRLLTGGYDIEPVKIRIPEGATIRDIAAILDNRLPEFNRSEFLNLASTSEGYLFPDTYFLLPTASTSIWLEEMKENFKHQIAPLSLSIFKSKHSLQEIIIMASILEKEGKAGDDRQMIAGILWKRIEAGMRLQVDAVFPYLIGKNTFNLTKTDLGFDSPYNTYRYAGLPPGPIGSPSLDSITAAINPIASPYWFYLSDKKGVMHYGINFEDHVANKRKYLQ